MGLVQCPLLKWSVSQSSKSFMNKDTVVASVIGFSLGLVAAIALWVVPKIMPKPNTSSQIADKTVNQEQPSASEVNGASSFEITSPKDGEIVKSKDLNLTGKVTSATLVVVTTPTSSIVLTPSEKGEFSTSLTLTEGANPITVAAYTKDTNESQKLFIYYEIE